MDGFANSFIGSAAAEVAVHGLRDLVIAGSWCLRQQSRRRHDLSGLAVAALRNFFRNPGLLQNVQSIRTQAFNGGDFLACDLRDGSGAGPCRRTIDVYGAGSAETGAAAEFCSGEFERIS